MDEIAAEDRFATGDRGCAAFREHGGDARARSNRVKHELVAFDEVQTRLLPRFRVL